ncbi:MAG: GerMN domain-containing protein [Candidatus Aminicenantes bacterium]|nr:GerMN domain-containing protein [Candidatus Aminicenantes bacterium]
MKRRRQKSIKFFLFILLLIIASLLALYFFFSGPKEKVKAAEKPERLEAEFEKTEVMTRQVTLYFPSENDDWLHPESREIRVGTPEKEAEEIIQELIAGSKKGYLSPLPPQARIRQVFITNDGTAYVDFSREIMEKHPSGSAAELTTIYAVVNSLISNIPAIKQVFFLIEGSERETLSGHINLNRPFVALPSIIAR